MPLSNSSITYPILLMALMGLILHQTNIDQTLFLHFNQPLSLLASTLWQSFTVLSDAWVATVLALVLISLYPEMAKTTLMAIILAAVITHAFKLVITAPRPYLVLDPDMLNHVSLALKGNNSMPSGHAVTAFTLAGLLAFHINNNRLTAVLFVAAFTCGLSRIILSAHWPSDVMFGGALGWAIAASCMHAKIPLTAVQTAVSEHANKHRLLPLGEKHPAIVYLAFSFFSFAMLSHHTRYVQAQYLIDSIAIIAGLWFVANAIIAFKKQADSTLA